VVSVESPEIGVYRVSEYMFLGMPPYRYPYNAGDALNRAIGASHCFSEELQDIVSGTYSPKNEMERACFDYVRSASEDPTSVPDEILGRLKQHLTPPQIVELACVVGFWKFYNAVHDSLHIPVESSLLGDTGYVNL